MFGYRQPSAMAATPGKQARKLVVVAAPVVTSRVGQDRLCDGQRGALPGHVLLDPFSGRRHALHDMLSATEVVRRPR
jgi:hypothetical protein